MFFLELNHEVKTHVYASHPEYCLIFNYEFTAQVEKHLVTGTVSLSLGSAIHRRRFSYRFKPRALRRMSRAHKGVKERDMTDVDEEELEEEQARVRTTSSGRILKLSNSFYSKHGLIKAQ